MYSGEQIVQEGSFYRPLIATRSKPGPSLLEFDATDPRKLVIDSFFHYRITISMLHGLGPTIEPTVCSHDDYCNNAYIYSATWA